MSSCREDSPDWLRCFQAPDHSTISLSSDSNHSPNSSPSRDKRIDSRFSEEGGDNDGTVLGESGANSPSKNISKAKSKKKRQNEGSTQSKEKKGGEDLGEDLVTEELTSEKQNELNAAKRSVWTLSSDSESCPDSSIKRCEVKSSVKDEDEFPIPIKKVSPAKNASKEKSPKKHSKPKNGMLKKEKNADANDNFQEKGAGDCDDEEIVEEDTSEKHIGSHVSSSRLPLVLSEKVQRLKALVECEGDSIDLSGDMGAVGRVVIPDASSGSSEMYFDLKGTIYQTKIVPSRTFCVVSFGQSEAKIEAIMNDLIQLKPQSNVYEAETMVEGTLEGFSFDSEDEADKIPKAASHQNDQNEGVEEQTNGKTKRKAEKLSGGVKKGKSASRKSHPGQTVRKKTQASKKARTKK